MSGEGIPVFGGPLDGGKAPHTEDAFTHQIGNVVHVYELWGDAYHLAVSLEIGPQRLTQGDT